MRWMRNQYWTDAVTIPISIAENSLASFFAFPRVQRLDSVAHDQDSTVVPKDWVTHHDLSLYVVGYH